MVVTLKCDGRHSMMYGCRGVEELNGLELARDGLKRELCSRSNVRALSPARADLKVGATGHPGWKPLARLRR